MASKASQEIADKFVVDDDILAAVAAAAAAGEVVRSLKLGNVWVFVQLICRPRKTTNQRYKNPNIA